MKVFSAFAVLVVFVVDVKTQKEYGYDDTNGPSVWPVNYPICGESRQSPIAINSNSAIIDYELGDFTRALFDSVAPALLVRNTGHSLQVDITDGYEILQSDVLPGAFKAAQFHIHWAKPGELGSEHTLDGVQYFGELHIVHYNLKYDNIAVAANQSDGLAVLGFFVDNTYPQDNLDFQRFLRLVENGTVVYDDDRYSFASNELFSIETFLPPNFNDEYYQYRGSLTTPPCYESVFWTVFSTPIRISENQAQILRTSLFENAEGETDTQLYGNFRPVQPLNGRIVKRKPACASASSSLLKNSILLQATAMLLAIFFKN